MVLSKLRDRSQNLKYFSFQFNLFHNFIKLSLFVTPEFKSNDLNDYLIRFKIKKGRPKNICFYIVHTPYEQMGP